MTGHLRCLGSEHLPLDEINGPYTWMIVTDYEIVIDADPETLLGAMLEDPGFALDAPDVGPFEGVHGPFRISALKPSSFTRIGLSEALRHIEEWIENEGPTVPLDPGPIMRRDVLPRLIGQEFFLLKAFETSDIGELRMPVEVLPIGGWVEVVAVDHADRRLRALVVGSD